MLNYVQGSNGPLDSLTQEGNGATSKATCHQSEAAPSRRIRRVHEDPRAHQSYQTASRQVMTHIHDMGAHLAVSRPRIGPFGHLFWSTDLHGRPTIGRCLWTSPFHMSTPHSMHRSVPGGRGPILGLKRPWHSSIYERGGGRNQDIHQVQLQASSLV